MITAIKKFLWQVGIIKSCPWCGSELNEVGHPDEDGYQSYVCTNDNCMFGR